MAIQTKRIYDAAEDSDGFRILVDRLWPRGLSKERARVDYWDKDIAPSAELRRAFHHEDLPYPEFVKAYREELAANSEALTQLRGVIAQHAVVTLLYAMKSSDHNHALLILEALEEHPATAT